MNPNLTDYLTALNDWHYSQYKHPFYRHGIFFNTLDNPGWHLIIKSNGNCEKIQWIKQEYSDDDWYHLCASENIFYSACGTGENNLLCLLHTAAKWLGLPVGKQSGFDYLSAMNDWYVSQCDGWWEHGNGISFSTIKIPGWKLSIDDEDASGKSDRADFILTRNQSDQDWYAVKTEHEPSRPEASRLFAACSNESLLEILAVSYRWLMK